MLHFENWCDVFSFGGAHKRLFVPKVAHYSCQLVLYKIVLKKKIENLEK